MIISNTESGQKPIDVHIKVLSSTAILPGLQALLAKGLSVRTRRGVTLSEFICGQLGVDPDYLKYRVQTLFLNHRPVDDAEKTNIADGDVVALSSAMPGLVGATLRKGGFYAKLRAGISYQETGAESQDQAVCRVTIRLFNVVAKELGPIFMEKGVIVDGRALSSFFKMAALVLTSPACTLIVDGEEISVPALLEKELSEQAVRLTLQTIVDSRG